MSFYADTIVKSPLFKSINRVSSLDVLFPPFRDKLAAILSDGAAQGHPFVVVETYRSNERQLQLFNQHLTQLKHVGVHHFGLAADVAFEINGEPSWKGDFAVLGTLVKKHGLVWGGNWNSSSGTHFHDWDHVQFINVADQNKLFALSWYPDVSYTVVEV